MSENQISIEVDGKTISAEKGQMLIEVTDANDIYIPRFCYHPKLSIAANCRMCLVEVEKAPKPLPACATPVMDGMVVKTQSPQALDSQKAVMEFLLINHPLDCPICDQGGECELQDLAMGYGRDVSRYQESKRVVEDKNIGPLVQTEMTRCIHCTRCVRFGEEIAGLRELGATGRGEHMEIGTYIEKSMQSELSGNVIDVCPVGALTSKPFRFSARSWEMKQGRGISPHDCVGSNLEIHIKGNKVKRVVPAENPAINEVWISDRDRFSYEALYSEDRLLQPKIKQNDQWKTVSWNEALEFAAAGINKVKRLHGATAIGSLISPSATVEEMYLMQSVMRSLGSHNIDHRLQQLDFSNDADMPAYPSLGCSINELENIDAALLVGSHLRYEQPMINHRIRKAALKGAKITRLDHDACDFNFSLAQDLVSNADDLVHQLAAITHIVTDKTNSKDIAGINQYLNRVSLSDKHKAIAQVLSDSDNAVILLGSHIFSHPEFSVICNLANAINSAINGRIGFLTQGANSAGAWLTGAIPHRSLTGDAISPVGLTTQQMFESDLKSYILFNIEADKDLIRQPEKQNGIGESEFVVSLTAYESDAIQDYADVMLPLALFAETEGSYVNVEGIVQKFEQLVKPMEEIKPGWKILHALATHLKLDSEAVANIDALHDLIMSKITSRIENRNFIKSTAVIQTQNINSVECPGSLFYSIDPMLRRAVSLQQREANR